MNRPIKEYFPIFLLPHLRSLRNFAGLALFFFLFTACSEPPDNGNGVTECPPGYIVGGVDSTECIPDTTIYLTVERIGITSIDLKIRVSDTSAVWAFGLSRNNAMILSAAVTEADTIVSDEELTPDRKSVV